MKVLVCGWFSFELMGASAGDILVRDEVCKWLDIRNISYDIAVAYPFKGGVDWQLVDSSMYTTIIFVCGPFGNGDPLLPFLEKFAKLNFIGVNLSMLESLDTWNPFDLLLERDSDKKNRPDLAFLSKKPLVPVVGLILVEKQKEYGDRARHDKANDALNRLIERNSMAIVKIDTRLDENKFGFRTESEIESIISKMDLVLTTRLHGTVLALKNHVPAIAIDPIAGGAKILQQTKSIGWPIIHFDDSINDQALQRSFEFCLSEEVKDIIASCLKKVNVELRNVELEMVKYLANTI